jgi:hypothetical protein
MPWRTAATRECPTISSTGPSEAGKELAGTPPAWLQLALPYASCQFHQAYGGLCG